MSSRSLMPFMKATVEASLVAARMMAVWNRVQDSLLRHAGPVHERRFVAIVRGRPDLLREFAGIQERSQGHRKRGSRHYCENEDLAGLHLSVELSPDMRMRADDFRVDLDQVVALTRGVFTNRSPSILKDPQF